MRTSLVSSLAALGLPLALALPLASSAFGQFPKPAITLEPQPRSEIAAAPLTTQEKSAFSNSSAKLPQNFHVFKSIKIGESADLERLTLHFEASAKLTGIESSPDFKVEQGSSCVEGNTYTANSTCTLLVRFTPKGPGPRSGKLTISHSASAKPMYVGLGGYGSGPIVSFTPAVISTIPSSYPSSKGLFTGATNIAVDGGDTVYVADTGNNQIRFLNSSGAFQNFTGLFSYTAPVGVSVDDFGTVYESQDNPDHIITNSYSGASSYSSSSSSCNVGQTCNFFNPGIYFVSPGVLAYDRNGNTFINTPYELIRLSQGSDGEDATPLSSYYDYSNLRYPLSLAVDTSDSTYTYYQFNGTCLISSQSYYSAANSLGQNRKVAGGSSACGFAGDGGPARNALISTYVGQMTFDIAGNFYFSDTGNQRVRRIDAATGIISTIAGNGTAGNTGDGTPATNATLNTPTGLGVDSQGQVYILSTTTGAAQLVRKLGPDGALSFVNQALNTASAAKIVTLSNTGNADLILSSVALTGPNAADFTIDPTTTVCKLVAGTDIPSGQSCKIGIIFKPSAAGTRTASLTFLDNSVTESNIVELTGTSTQPTAVFAITAPATGATVAAGSSVVFSVSVTAATGPTPTGTVKFTVSGATYGSPVTLSGGAASVTVTNLAQGTRTLGATYSGDANYAAQGPITRAITVTAAAKAPAKVTLQAKTNPATTCTPAQFSVAISGSSATKPTGQVQLMEGKQSLATGTLSNGVITLTASALKAGSHTLVASYAGDSTHAPSTSTPIQEVVNAGACKLFFTGPIQ